MTLPTLYRQNDKLQAYLGVVEFLNMIKKGEILQAAKFSENELARFAKYSRTKKQGYINIPIYTKSQDKIILKPIEYINGLLCYADPLEQAKNTQMGNLLKHEQILLLIDVINNLILAGKSIKLINSLNFIQKARKKIEARWRERTRYPRQDSKGCSSSLARHSKYSQRVGDCLVSNSNKNQSEIYT